MAVESKNKNFDLTARTILKINKALIRRFGIPKRNLISDPFDILVATILSQNTNDLNSHKAFQNLKSEFNNYDQIISTDLRKIEKAIKVAGLGKQKAKSIKNFLYSLKKEKGELNLNFLKSLEIKDALEYLTKFNGIGVKTAACVLLFGLNKNVCPVDTHIHRILNRLKVVQTKNRDKTFQFLLQILPDGIAHEFHTNLIKLGRTICLSRNPKCYECPLIDFCKYEMKNFAKSNSQKTTVQKDIDFMLLDNV